MTEKKGSASKPADSGQPGNAGPADPSRRKALKGIGATLGAAAFVTAISPLRNLAQSISAEELMQ